MGEKRGRESSGQRQGEYGPDRGGGNNRSAQYSTASESALASGVHNAGFYNARGPWYEISCATSREKYFTHDFNINRIINLTTENLNRPEQLSKILNTAGKEKNDTLERIIKGWGDKLSDMLKTVIAQVGAEYKFKKDNKKGSQEISLIFMLYLSLMMMAQR